MFDVPDEERKIVAGNYYGTPLGDKLASRYKIDGRSLVPRVWNAMEVTAKALSEGVRRAQKRLSTVFNGESDADFKQKFDRYMGSADQSTPVAA